MLEHGRPSLGIAFCEGHAAKSGYLVQVPAASISLTPMGPVNPGSSPAGPSTMMSKLLVTPSRSKVSCRMPTICLARSSEKALPLMFSPRSSSTTAAKPAGTTTRLRARGRSPAPVPDGCRDPARSSFSESPRGRPSGPGSGAFRGRAWHRDPRRSFSRSGAGRDERPAAPQGASGPSPAPVQGVAWTDRESNSTPCPALSSFRGSPGPRRQSPHPKGASAPSPVSRAKVSQGCRRRPASDQVKARPPCRREARTRPMSPREAASPCAG